MVVVINVGNASHALQRQAARATSGLLPSQNQSTANSHYYEALVNFIYALWRAILDQQQVPSNIAFKILVCSVAVNHSAGMKFVNVFNVSQDTSA
eukprot:6037956-Amphidinium_carterae.1